MIDTKENYRIIRMWNWMMAWDVAMFFVNIAAGILSYHRQGKISFISILCAFGMILLAVFAWSKNKIMVAHTERLEKFNRGEK